MPGLYSTLLPKTFLLRIFLAGALTVSTLLRFNDPLHHLGSVSEVKSPSTAASLEVL